MKSPGSNLIFVVFTANQGEITVGEYYETGQTTEFRYCTKISEGARNFGILPGVYDEVSRNQLSNQFPN